MSGRVRRSWGSRIEPAAFVASSGSQPAATAYTVEGAPLKTAAQVPATIASRLRTPRAYGARMASPELPPALAVGIDELVERSNRARLEAAARRLSDAYRAE